MSWAIGYDSTWDRDIGYGVPAQCDSPGCSESIDRGLGYICGDGPYGGETGCGLFFCGEHGGGNTECIHAVMLDDETFRPSADVPEWINWKLTDASWAQWRADNPEAVAVGCAREETR